MLAATGRPLVEMTAADVMSRSVIVVPEDMPLREAAHLLMRHQVTGAPVVNYCRTVVGVLSATDFVRHLHVHPNSIGCSPACFLSDWQIADVDAVPEDAVKHFMTADAVTVSPDTPVRDLARMMVDAHIHRVIVVDGQGQPIGIVASTDVLAAVARTDESATEH